MRRSLWNWAIAESWEMPRPGEQGQAGVLVCPDLVDQLEACVDIAQIDIALGDHEGCFFPGGGDGNGALDNFSVA